jgi:hypothetical protein
LVVNIKSIPAVLKFSVLVSLLFSFLFADKIWPASLGFWGAIIRKTAAIFHDPATQWMAVACLAFYIIIFLFVEQRAGFYPAMAAGVSRLNAPEMTGRSRRIYARCRNFFLNPNLWLATLVALVFLLYACAYQAASSSTRVSVLLAGIVFGKAISAWIRGQNNLVEQYTLWLAGLLTFFLAYATLWQLKPYMTYQYHGVIRWSGVWDNPNFYGLLMGTGVILALGIGIREWQMADGGRRKALCFIFCLIAAMLTGYGLSKSYSRGAWLGTVLGLFHLVVQAVKSSRFSVYFRRNRFLLGILIASLTTLMFWQFHFSESLLSQRAFSVANANDFSWRNRVAAWQGSIHMMVDRPLVGVGWASATSLYQNNYLPPQLNDPGAIQTNDFFMLGVSAGMPVLFCLAAYLALSFRRRPAGLSPPFSIFTVCRSGSIVLLVGFWFDGGLFKLATATVFWTLMELSRLESFIPLPIAPVQPAAEDDVKSNVTAIPRHGGWEKRLRWVATILAVLATAQTIVYLGTPLLPVGDETLAVARKCLISQHEIKDFDFLSTNEIWRGKKIKVLLEHVQLANYDRQLINWTLDNETYQHFVLSPVITGRSDEQLDWRRPLWEEFYPRIRHAASPEEAAKIVFAHLHERVTIATLPNPPREVPEIWIKQITSEAGFEIIYVAALRSVGVPARLDSNGKAEFWDGNKWQAAP